MPTLETKMPAGAGGAHGADFPLIKGAIDKIGYAFDGFKESQEQKHGALQERVEILEARASNPKAAAVDERFEAIERHLIDNPRKTAVDSHVSAIDHEHKTRFLAWLRRPKDMKAISDLHEIQERLAAERKDMSVGSNADGGYAVPQQIAADIERLELKLSPVRRLVKVLPAASSDFHHIASIGGTSSGWSSETGTRSATDTPQLRDIVPTHGELYAYPVVSNWALQDVFFDLAAYLTQEIASSFAFQEGDAVINGDGSNKPTGMLNTDPVLTADFASPLRAAAAYEYVAIDSDTLGSPQVPGLTADGLVDLLYSLNSAYRNGATWTMNSTTAAAVRKLKDGSGRYVWADSLALGQPSVLLGYPVEIWEQMPDIGLNNFPVAFGNFSRGYLLMERLGLQITRDEVTTPGLTKFYVRRREGGIPLNNDAIKFGRTIG